jgi:DNA repair exonuclease SbcCD ATPase subunit
MMIVDIPGLISRFNNVKEDYNKDKGKLDSLIESKQGMQDELVSLDDYLITLNQTNILFQKTSEFQRKKACRQIEELGTFALQYVFGHEFRLEISMTPSGKKPEAEIYIVSMEEGQEIRTTAQDSRGGGIVDIVSLALKIVILQAYEPKIDGPIILDEPGKHVSSEYIMPLANFLKEVSQKFDRQIILVTHNPYLAETADKKLMVMLVNGKSKVI